MKVVIMFSGFETLVSPGRIQISSDSSGLSEFAELNKTLASTGQFVISRLMILVPSEFLCFKIFLRMEMRNLICSTCW